MSAVATPPVHSQRHQPARLQPHPHRPAWRRLRRHGPPLLLFAVTALFMLPFYWVFAHSFESAAEFQRSGPALWPAPPPPCHN
jgi:ABC-type glycerol-3-phosphate transport system permease component